MTSPIDAYSAPSDSTLAEALQPAYSHADEAGESAKPDTTSRINKSGYRLYRTGRHALYAEFAGSSISLLSLNYEQEFRPDYHLRAGVSFIGFMAQINDDSRGNDVFFSVFTIPISFSRTYFPGIRQLEAGLGLTYISASTAVGPFPYQYDSIELSQTYRGLAITGIVGYRISVNDFVFRIGLHPHYMFTFDSEITGYLEELDVREGLGLAETLNFKGFRVLPGLSFGRTF